MFKGWFVGNFTPTVSKQDFEVGVKRFKKGDVEPRHYHKIATEISVVIDGKIKMNDDVYGKDSIIVIEPNERNTFEALEDCALAIVKMPCVKDDKFIEE
jgi:quercetin dioxygenase-like cupin family protein